MQEVMRYFHGERVQCSIGIAISPVSAGIALFFLFQNKPAFYKGMAYVFLIPSAFLLIICSGVVLRTPRDIQRVSGYVGHYPEKIVAHEVPRMEGVIKNFTIVKIAEACLIIIGSALFIASPRSSLWKGIGLGLCIHAAVLLAFVITAARRGNAYVEYLHTMTNSETRAK
jgi:hypothetical protein